MTDPADRLSDEDVAWMADPDGKYPLAVLAREVQERRAADTRTPTFTDDEMTAIRQALRSMSSMLAPHHQASQSFVVEHCYHLPPNVAAWVLGESPVPCQTCGGSGEVVITVKRVHARKLVDAPVSCPCPTCGGEQ